MDECLRGGDSGGELEEKMVKKIRMRNRDKG